MYTARMIPVLLIAIAVIILAAPGWPAPTTLAAFVLALAALLMVVLHWGPSHL